MKDNKYSPMALDCLPREELRRMFVEELHKPSSESDDDFIRLLIAELNNRGADPAFVDDAAVDEACAKFRENTKKAQVPRKRWHQSWIVKVASVLLVLGVLFFALPGSTEANDINDVLSWWSDSLFRFFAPGKQPNTHTYVFETDHPGLQEIFNAVTELGITDPVVPTWVPDGFELTELKVHQALDFSAIHAHLINKDHQLLLSFVVNQDSTNFQHEKDNEPVNILELSGYDHYMISNNGEQIVTWMAYGIECTITTDCTEEDAYRIVKSIYTSEG